MKANIHDDLTWQMNIMRHISGVGSDLLPVSKCPFENHIMNMSISFKRLMFCIMRSRVLFYVDGKIYLKCLGQGVIV